MKQLLLAVTVLALSSCANPADKIVINPNPHPIQGYMITLDASQAPGPIGEVSAYMSFDVSWSGEACMPPAPGIVEWRMPRKYMDISLEKVRENVFQGVVYLDWIKDERYFDKGLCAWHMNTVGANFKGQGGLGFGTGIGYTTFKSGVVETAYYPIEEFTEDASGRSIKVAFAVPTNDFTKDPENSYVNDKSKYFPIYLKADALPNTQGLTVPQEFEKRTGEKLYMPTPPE